MCKKSNNHEMVQQLVLRYDGEKKGEGGVIDGSEEMNIKSDGSIDR